MSRWCTRIPLQPTTMEWYDGIYCDGDLHYHIHCALEDHKQALDLDRMLPCFTCVAADNILILLAKT